MDNDVWVRLSAASAGRESAWLARVAMAKSANRFARTRSIAPITAAIPPVQHGQRPDRPISPRSTARQAWCSVRSPCRPPPARRSGSRLRSRGRLDPPRPFPRPRRCPRLLRAGHRRSDPPRHPTQPDRRARASHGSISAIDAEAASKTPAAVRTTASNMGAGSCGTGDAQRQRCSFRRSEGFAQRPGERVDTGRCGAPASAQCRL